MFDAGIFRPGDFFMSAEAIAGFMQGDYGVVAGVKMLNCFRFLGKAGLLGLGILCCFPFLCSTSGAACAPMARSWDLLRR